MPYLPISYDGYLVAASFAVAVLAAYTTLSLAARVSLSAPRAARTWLLGGAFSLGTGIWSMHFIGMLAAGLPVRVSYDIGITLLSLLIAIVVSGFALFLASRNRVSAGYLVAGGAAMGLGICAMHYVGMFAMRMSPAISYDPGLFFASVAIAISASIGALWIVSSFSVGDTVAAHVKKLAGAPVMGAAIVVMHYTGMAATHIAPNSICLVEGGINNVSLAMMIGSATVVILGITLLLSLVDARLASRTARLVRSLRDANAQLHHLTLHDNLTKLPNRTLLEDRILQTIAAKQRSGGMFALMFLDLDRFKTINDSLGHHYGDKQLQATAQRLTGILRADDTVARLGGDEFVVLLTNVAQPQTAAHVAEKILAALAQPFEIEQQEQHISCSIGISIYPDDGADLRALMVNADGAMYHAKKVGRGNYQFFTPEMNAAASTRLEVEKRLRRAIDQQEFELHYQPRVDIHSGAVVAMEALVRWRDPHKGLIPPNEFIPLAEELGLIIPLGAWVMRAACEQNKRWQMAGLSKLRVAVNLSAVQFRQKNLVEFIMQVLRETQLDASFLELEVTESVVMDNAEEAVVVLEKLHANGIHLSIDDFGTGYSSLSYLKRFPLDTLKIDRSFVRDLSTDPDDAAIVRSVIALAHSLRLKVIAEGVETEEQLAFLRSLNCDEYQGYYCSRPLPVAQFERFMRDVEGAEPEKMATAAA